MPVNRRRFLETGGATAVGAAVATKSKGGSARSTHPQTRATRAKRKVLTDKAPQPLGPYSQAIVAGGTIYVAGQGPVDPKTGKIETTAFEAQADQTFANIKAIVEAAGSTLSKVVRVNVYLANLNDFAKMNEVYRRYFSGDFPARTTVGTQLLGGMLIEVDCIAVV